MFLKSPFSSLLNRDGPELLSILTSEIVVELSAAVSLFQYHDDENGYVALASKIVLSLFTIFTTLIASWMKKQNYVERIAELDKYILNLQKLNQKYEKLS